ncbi:MAG: hypothetical protein HQL30_05415 [Candidatus Omnitrophica bacterium]|nr:hypothetical protein [Candidatus Omnitrophota bacterium]
MGFSYFYRESGISSDILVVQADNREIEIAKFGRSAEIIMGLYPSFPMDAYNASYSNAYDFVALTFLVNILKTRQLKWQYERIKLLPDYYAGKHPCWGKIVLLEKLLNCPEYKKHKIVIFVDSDSWIRDQNKLKSLTDYLLSNTDINGIFSRDTYVPTNTYVNSGAFILKNNDYVRDLYSEMVSKLDSYSNWFNKLFYDQVLVSDTVFKNKSRFLICKPNILNSPAGDIIRHNWLKQHKSLMESLKDEIIVSQFNEIFDNAIIEELDIEKIVDREPLYVGNWREIEPLTKKIRRVFFTEVHRIIEKIERNTRKYATMLDSKRK